MQSTGQTSIQERSIVSMQGSAITYVNGYLPNSICCAEASDHAFLASTTPTAPNDQSIESYHDEPRCVKGSTVPQRQSLTNTSASFLKGSSGSPSRLFLARPAPATY